MMTESIKAMESIKVGALVFSGESIDACQSQAIAHLARLCSESEPSFTPIILRSPDALHDSKDDIGCVYRDATGNWSYCINWANPYKVPTNRSDCWSRKEAVSACRAHLARP
jgi:hypothetical protein